MGTTINGDKKEGRAALIPNLMGGEIASPNVFSLPAAAPFRAGIFF